MAERIRDITAEDGALWLNLGYVAVLAQERPFRFLIYFWNRLPSYLIQEVAWNYGAGVAARNSLSPRNERSLWCVSDPSNYRFNLDAIRDPEIKYPNQKKEWENKGK